MKLKASTEAGSHIDALTLKLISSWERHLVRICWRSYLSNNLTNNILYLRTWIKWLFDFIRASFSFWFTVYLLLILWCWTVCVQKVNPDESSKMMSLSKGWSDEYRIALTKYIWVNNVWTELLTSSKHFWDLGKDQISEFNSQMSKATLRIPCLPNINKDTIDELFKWIQWISLYLKCSIINLFNVVTDHILRIHPQAGLSYKSQVQPRFRWFRAVVSHKKVQIIV